MDIKELKELIDATIYPNGEKKIKASNHQLMLHEIVDYTDENITTINEGLGEVKNTLESQGNDVEQLKESSKQAELNDAKVNQKIDNLASNIVGLGGDIKGSAKGADVIELPSVAINGVAPKTKIEGLTLVNVVNNGNFKNGTANWRSSGGSFNNKNEVVGGGNYSYISAINSPFKTNVDDLLYLSAKNILVDNSRCTRLNLSSKGKVIFPITNPSIGTHNISGVYKSEGNEEMAVTQSYANNSDTTGVVLKFDYLQIINLTQMFGKGNEPTQEWCDKHIKGYIDGVQSVQTPLRVKSIGENLWNGVVEKGTRNSITGQIIPSENVFRSRTNIYVGGSEYIRIVSVNTGQVWFYFYDKSFKYLERIYLDLNKENHITLKMPDKAYLMGFNGAGEGHLTPLSRITITDRNLNKDALMLPYQESLAYFNDEIKLSSITNTKDFIENGKLYKNIERHYFTKEDEWALRDDYEGDNFRYFMTIPFEYKTTGSGVEGELFCNNYTATSNVASVLTERDSNTIALYRENSSTIYLTLDKKVDDVNSAIPENTFIDVILPETEQIKLDTSGVVTTKANGTIFIENIKNVTDFYTTSGLDIKDFKELVSIYKYEGSDLIQLDASKAVFTTTLKHPDLTDGDLVFFEYKYLDSPLWGDNEIEYFNKNNVLQSENGKLWKKVEKASNEGVLTTELKEIV